MSEFGYEMCDRHNSRKVLHNGVGVPDQVASLATNHLLNVLIWIEGFLHIFPTI